MTATYQFGFVIEQALGHITHGRNLQEHLRHDTAVHPFWVLPAQNVKNPLSRLPVVGSNWTVQAGLQARKQLAEITRQTKLDALFFHTQVTAVLAQDWVQRVPSIVSLDATPYQYDQLGAYYNHTSGSRWLEQLKWRMNRNCFRKARKLITWSEWAKQGLVEEYEVPPEKVTVISPGVNTRFWARSEPPYATPRESLKILFVGGNLERKGGSLLLKAFRALRRERASGVPLELHLVTKDPLPPEPGVFVYNHMQPNSPDLRHLYHESDIFCLPTKGDCLPMVLSEAGAAGLPVISTHIAAIPEIIQEGKNGYLIAPDDFGSLKAALQTLIEDNGLRLQMGAESVKLIQEKHDAETNTSRLLGLLKEMVDDDRFHQGRG